MSTIKSDKTFLVVGCGGLGCFIIESLLRLNVKAIRVCDADFFVESNLNRQLYATPSNLQTKKTDAAFNRSKELEYAGNFEVFDEFFTAENADKLLQDVDIVIDALDNVQSRLILEDECAKKGIPIVHGAVGDFVYQIAVAMPGAGLLHEIYSDTFSKEKPQQYSFMVQLCAAREVSEAIKIANGINSNLINSLLVCDIKENEEQIISFE